MKWISILMFLIGLLPHGTLIAQGYAGESITIPHATAILDFIID
ncbi:hypothetical protein [Dyadobacter sp. OTU695]